MELCSEINDNDNEEKKVELKEENKQLEEENEASKTGNSQEELADSTIAISTSQSADMSNDLELEETEQYVPNWLIEVLAFIYRKEMANSSLSFSNKIFQLLCWPKLHQKVKPHKIPDLWCTAIRHNEDNFRAQFQCLDTYKRGIIPIASTPAPHYIDGFGRIRLDFVDEQVVDFIKSIDRLLQNCDLCVLFFVNYLEMDKEHSAPIHALLEYLADKIFKFTINSLLDNFEEPFLKGFNRLFPGILDQIEFLHFNSLLAIDDIDAIHNWLTNQSIKGKQKIIRFNPTIRIHMDTFINHIKEEFSNSNSPSIFFIYFPIYVLSHISEIEEFFTLENSQTNEILTYNRREDQDRNWNFVLFGTIPKRRRTLEGRWTE